MPRRLRRLRFTSRNLSPIIRPARVFTNASAATPPAVYFAKPLTDYPTCESFHECLGGYAACDLLRETSHRLSDLREFSRMPRRLRRLRFTSRKLSPIIRTVRVFTNASAATPPAVYCATTLSDYPTCESFHECLGGYAACGLLRENSQRLSDLEIIWHSYSETVMKIHALGLV